MVKREPSSSPEPSIKREASSNPEPSPERTVMQILPTLRQPPARNPRVYVVLYEQHDEDDDPETNDDKCIFRGVFRDLAEANQEAIRVCSEVYDFWETAHDEDRDDDAPFRVLNYGTYNMSLTYARGQDSSGSHMIQKWLTLHRERQFVMHDADERCIHTVYVSTQLL